MAFGVSKGKICELLTLLKKWRPECNPLYYMIKNSHASNNTWPRIKIYVDTEEVKSCQTIICKAIEFYKPPYNTAYFAFSTNTTNLQTVLKQDGVIDSGEEYTTFELVPTRLIEPIKQVICQQMDYVPTFEVDYITFDFDKNAPKRKSCESMLPKGLSIGPLSTSYIKLLEEKNILPFIPKFAKTLQHYRHLAAYDENNRPVSWVIQKECGDIGYTFTQPALRGRKIFTILLEILAAEKQVHQDGHYTVNPIKVMHLARKVAVGSSYVFNEDVKITRLCLKKRKSHLDLHV